MMELEASGIFWRNYESTKRIVVNRGGTRSGKTYSLAQLAVLWLITGNISENQYIGKGTFSIVRKTLPSLKASVYRDVEEILHNHNIYQLCEHNKTDRLISYKGRTLEFFSADDQQKIRGRKRNILFCNEANELNYKTEFFQLAIRTTDKIFIDFNPDDENIWINKQIEQERASKKGDVDVIVSTYKDNPFLDRVTVEEIEYLEETDPEYWKIYGLGQYGRITGLIFPNFQTFQQWPDVESVVYGLDFGYTNDPTALVKIGIKGGDLFLSELIYDTGLTNNDIVTRFKQLALDKRARIFADAAEPKSIEEIRRNGYRIAPAKKGKDSILHGINLVKSYNLFIDSKSVNLQREQRSYKWKVDANGDATNKPLDKNNHLWDAVRYGLSMIQKRKTISKFARKRMR
jgi:phage terminase large subunit